MLSRSHSGSLRSSIATTGTTRSAETRCCALMYRANPLNYNLSLKNQEEAERCVIPPIWESLRECCPKAEIAHAFRERNNVD